VNPDNPLTVKVLFFSVLEDITGCRQWNCPWESGDTLSSITWKIFTHWPGLKVWENSLLCAVNFSYQPPEAMVTPGDEVAFMPPTQGG
jgi:molybdopterin converting factor small subunit